ncbi:hypothetical protein EYF80_017510 [Liparis tanakae]|uniref:Uncharacterized protein n=1 Tax=Liparis tanakae TaxID=230148 RepID=A0A4Z2I2C8_9TELE|nr:hypothetical protein EYF80_017510 [Liparis tanakae]
MEEAEKTLGRSQASHHAQLEKVETRKDSKELERVSPSVRPEEMGRLVQFRFQQQKQQGIAEEAVA